MTGWSGNYHELDGPWPASGRTRVYDLGQALVPGMTRHPYHPPYAFVLARQHGQSPYPGGVTSAMELIAMGGHVGTHVDATGHIACDGAIHGGHRVLEHQSPSAGLGVGSTEEIPPLIGPGHLIDAEALFGRRLEPADGIGPDELERWFADRAAPGPGSIVLVRTGWMRYWDDSDRYLGLATGLPGVTRDGAEWLSDRGILASGSDTMNYEHKPDPKVVALSVHVHYLVERGVFIMESVNLERLAEDGVTDFTFIAIPLRIRGGTGSPIRPVAVVAG